MKNNRKQFLKQLSAGVFFSAIPSWAGASKSLSESVDEKDFEKNVNPEDEKYWNEIARKYYPVADDYINLENGYFGVQAKPVLDAFLHHTKLVNTQLAKFTRKEYPGIAAEIKKQLALFLGVSHEEIIITRNATEALNIAIQGYPFQPGDEVLLSQLDYFSMIETFYMLERRGRIKVNSLELPLQPQSEDEIIEAYKKAITPKTKLILLTQVSNINGLIVPVAKIAAMAKQTGIDIICDSAHALGQVPFQLADLGADFVGMNLHKWIGNPLGAGVLYVRKERIPSMNALFGDTSAPGNSINKLGHIGTTSMAVTMTIPDSIAFHQMMGIENISRRMHYLKSIWLNKLARHPMVEIVSPAQENLSCAIASFRVKNRKSTEIADELWKKYQILTVARTLGENGCIRVTPSLYTKTDDINRLNEAIKQLAGANGR